MLWRGAESAQPVLAVVIGRRIHQCRHETVVMGLGSCTHQRIAFESAWCCSAWNIDPLLGVIGVQN